MYRQNAGRIIAAILVLILAWGLCGCGGGGGGGGTTVSITGIVRDDGTLVGVSGAQVTLNGTYVTTTDSNGAFSFASVTGSSFTVSVVLTGYNGLSNRAVYSTITNTIYLVPSLVSGAGNVAGTVTSAGTAVSGAYVTATAVSGSSLKPQATIYYAYTKSDGTYTIYNVPIGSQTIEGTATNGYWGSQTVTVQNGATATANIAVTNSPPPPPF